MRWSASCAARHGGIIVIDFIDWRGPEIATTGRS